MVLSIVSTSKLEGILYVDKENHAIAKTVYRIKSVLDISATSTYSYDKEEDLWFPDRQSLKVVKGNKKGDVKILGETIRFSPEDELENKRNTKKEASDYVYILSESKISEVEFNVPVHIQHRYVGIEIRDEAISRNEHYWTPYRKDIVALNQRNAVSW